MPPQNVPIMPWVPTPSRDVCLLVDGASMGPCPVQTQMSGALATRWPLRRKIPSFINIVDEDVSAALCSCSPRLLASNGALHTSTTPLLSRPSISASTSSHGPRELISPYKPSRPTDVRVSNKCQTEKMMSHRSRQACITTLSGANRVHAAERCYPHPTAHRQHVALLMSTAEADRNGRAAIATISRRPIIGNLLIHVSAANSPN